MKLYRTTTGKFVATQAEAGKGFEPVEVPSVGRGELAAFLNGLIAFEMEKPGPLPLAPELEPATNVIPLEAPRQAATARTADDIVAFILDEAAVHQVENILAAIGTRFGELAKERRHGRG